jgi:hypothetical protein
MNNGEGRVLDAELRLRLVWTSRHNFGKADMLKLHLIEAEGPETLAELYQVCLLKTCTE